MEVFCGIDWAEDHHDIAVEHFFEQLIEVPPLQQRIFLADSVVARECSLEIDETSIAELEQEWFDIRIGDDPVAVSNGLCPEQFLVDRRRRVFVEDFVAGQMFRGRIVIQKCPRRNVKAERFEVSLHTAGKAASDREDGRPRTEIEAGIYFRPAFRFKPVVRSASRPSRRAIARHSCNGFFELDFTHVAGSQSS